MPPGFALVSNHNTQNRVIYKTYVLESILKFLKDVMSVLITPKDFKAFQWKLIVITAF